MGQTGRFRTQSASRQSAGKLGEPNLNRKRVVVIVQITPETGHAITDVRFSADYVRFTPVNGHYSRLVFRPLLTVVSTDRRNTLS